MTQRLFLDKTLRTVHHLSDLGAAMPEQSTPASPSPSVPESAQTPDVIDATRLFGAAKEVQIELQGVRYRLRITRRGKLILQK